MDALRDYATDVVRRLREAGHVAYFAGGCVRDLLLGRTAKDYDVATSARPEEVRQLFGTRRTLAVGESFGVIIVLGPRSVGQVEVATFRTDATYSDGRRPDHVIFCTPEEDAQRRDFTINGMFYDPIDAQVLDFVGGEHDLSQRVIRAIRDPHERMREDKLRMLRAVRFTATLDFQLDVATADAIRSMADQLTVVSAERIAQELKKMLVDTHRRRAIELCINVGLFAMIFPSASGGCQPPDSAHDGASNSAKIENVVLLNSGEDSAVDLRATRNQGVDTPRSGKELARTLAMLELLETPSFELALATLLHTLDAEPTVRAICRRLKLSNDETDRTVWLVQHQTDLVHAPRLSLAALKKLLAHPYRDDLLQLMRVDVLAREADLHAVLFCEEFLARTPPEILNPPPLITGNDLIQMGLRPGPRFKEILETIRDGQLNLELTSAAEALALAQRLQQTSSDVT